MRDEAIEPTWTVYVPDEGFPLGYKIWANGFGSKEEADEWVAKQGGFPGGMRVGRWAIVWEE